MTLRVRVFTLAWAGAVLAGCGAAAPAPSSPTLSPAAVTTPSAPTPSASTAPVVECPRRPWTLASLVAVTALPLDPDAWTPGLRGRASCFGDAALQFDAIGGAEMRVVPGIALPAALGETFLWFSLRRTTPGSNDFDGLLLPGRLGQTEQDALERTRNPEPGVGWGGGTWWRVAGHFDDAGARQCRPREAYLLDQKLIQYTEPQAIELCRELFVIDSLTWLPAAPGSASSGTG